MHFLIEFCEKFKEISMNLRAGGQYLLAQSSNPMLVLVLKPLLAAFHVETSVVQIVHVITFQQYV